MNVKPLARKIKVREGQFYYLEVVTGEKLDPCSTNTRALNMKSQVFSSPMHHLLMDLGHLGSDLNKRDHVIIVGGPGNSQDRSYYYSIEKDINLIRERSNSMNVGFTNLFWRHDKPWINRKMRSENNLRLHWDLLGCGKTHILVIEETLFQR